MIAPVKARAAMTPGRMVDGRRERGVESVETSSGNVGFI